MHLRTSQIRPGDTVCEHGMRVRIDQTRTYPCEGHGHNGGTPYSAETCTVYAHLGTVTNVAEVRQAGIVPPSFLWDEERFTRGPGHGREDAWVVQGNDLATWWVERPQATCSSRGCEAGAKVQP
jgi:hypothetical protein